MDAADFCLIRRAELDVIAAADQVLAAIRKDILSIRKAHTRARADKIDEFVRSMDFFRLCEWAQEDPHELRHEFCRMILRQRGGVL